MGNKKPYGYWNIKENCIADAKKYNTRNEWQKKSRIGYNSARKHGWMTECCSHMVKGKIIKWTKECCIEDAKNYQSRFEWRKKSPGAYNRALKFKFLDECCKHMKEKPHWTEELCIEDSKKYSSRSKWYKKSSGAYSFAKRKGLLDKCFPLSFKHKKSNNSFDVDLEKHNFDSEKYEFRKDFFKIYFNYS